MKDPISRYWELRMERVKSALETNNFDVFITQHHDEARALLMDTILPGTKARSASWGGSMTAFDAGIYDALLGRKNLEVIHTSEKNISVDEMLERRRRALLVDLFITGTNAITEQGQLVNLDMIGNRIAGLTFGPRHVVVVAGRNKITRDLDAAMYRIKEYAAPVNTMRLEKKTPCYKTGRCMDCKSPDRICNTWTITEKSFPPRRVKVILINQDLGF
jgi:hypothetical protein